MYADKITDSMKYAIDETNRRRAYQEEYNTKHNITPVGIQKDIRDSLVEQEDKVKRDFDIEVEKLSERQKKLLIKDLRAKMLLAADNLQFEKAAQLRDRIKELSL